MHSPETNRAEFPCSLDVPAEPHPTYTTQARRFLDLLRRGCIASASLPDSKWLFESLRGFRLWAPPNIFESAPRRPRVLLRRHCHSGKRSLTLVRGGPLPDEGRLEHRNRTHKSH